MPLIRTVITTAWAMMIRWSDEGTYWQGDHHTIEFWKILPGPTLLVIINVNITDFIWFFFFIFFDFQLNRYFRAIARDIHSFGILVFHLWFLVLPPSALQIANVQGGDGIHAIQTSGGGGTIVQYAAQSQDGQFFVPGKYNYNCQLFEFKKCLDLKKNTHSVASYSFSSEKKCFIH